MADRITTNRVRGQVLGMGMDLVGFGPVDRWDHAPYLLSPRAILPQCRTVIVAGIHITDAWTEMGGEPQPQDRSPGGWMDQNSLLDRVAYRTVRLLNDRGYRAIAIASSNIWRYRQFPGVPSLFAPDLSHIHAATAAGLAEIGWSGLAITPEFGPRVRFISVVTDAPLTPTPMYAGPPLCDLCGQCVQHCPTRSLSKELGKPHEVVIGGRTFRYANKNVWRCAWAEHFNLDMDSANLQTWDRIGEREILQEIADKGKRGHERGVCQKWCVPPHLRTDRPSFGRPDKPIAMNRVNRRYGPNMPTLRKMRDDLLAAAAAMGIEVSAVGPLTRDVPTDPPYTVEKEFPGGKTILAFGWANPAHTYPSPITDWYWLDLHHAMIRLARMVEDCGYYAASYVGNEELCEMAGLGTRGPDGRLAVPELGKHIVVGCVVTDAVLDPTPPGLPWQSPPPRTKLAPKKLRARLEALAEENLVSLFGVAPAERLGDLAAQLGARLDMTGLQHFVTDSNQNYHGRWVSTISPANARVRSPRDHLPSARSVIVMGMHFPPELIENAGLPQSQQIGPYAFWQYQTRPELCLAAAHVARQLTAMGYLVAASEDMLGIGSMVDSHRGLLPDARCNVLEAVAAGLGEVAPSGALLTPRHGPHQRLIVLITDAELPADAVYAGPRLCRQCGACRKQCPMQALPGGGIDLTIDGAAVRYPAVDQLRCDWSKRYALCKEEGPELIGNKTDVPKPVGKVSIEDIVRACVGRDPVMKRRPCILETCLRQCPAGAAANQ